MASEIYWYKQYMNPKSNILYEEISMLSKTVQLGHVEDSMMVPLNEMSVMPDQLQPEHKFRQRQDSLSNESGLPKLAKTRLPFHIFTANKQEVVKNYQAPLIFNEITIYNVHNWITVIECTKNILHHSRTSLLVGTISSHVRETVKYKRKLSNDELKQMEKLIYESHNHLSILKGVASRFKRLSLGETKIALIKLCCDVIMKWIQNFDILKIPEDQHSKYEQLTLTFNELLAVLTTELEEREAEERARRMAPLGENVH